MHYMANRVYAVVWRSRELSAELPMEEQGGLLSYFHSKKLAKKVAALFNGSPLHGQFVHEVVRAEDTQKPEWRAEDIMVPVEPETAWSLEQEAAESEAGIELSYAPGDAP